jgi:hypothetical protein
VPEAATDRASAAVRYYCSQVAPVNLSTQLGAQVQRYLAHETSLEAVEDWMAEHALDIEAADDSDTRQFLGLVWLLISEHDRGDRSEESVRAELSAALRPAVVAAEPVAPRVSR